MTPKLFRAADVCEMAQLQPYVLRSWEKEFPGIGVQKSPESPRLYRQSDIEQVQKIKQLVFGEGLTLSGARRRLEQTTAAGATERKWPRYSRRWRLTRARASPVFATVCARFSAALAAPGTVVVVDDYRLTPTPVKGRPGARSRPGRKRASSPSRRPSAETARLRRPPSGSGRARKT